MNQLEYLKKIENIFNSAHNGIVIIDEFGVVLVCNKAACKLVNKSPYEMIGKDADEIIPDSRAVLKTILKTGQPQIEVRIEVGDAIMIVNSSPIFQDKHIIGVLSIFQEISEYENIITEVESYKQINRQLDAIIEASSDGLWISNHEGKLIRINRASEILNDVKPEEVVGRNMADIVKSGLIDRSATLEALESKRQVSILQYISRTKKYLLATGTPAFDEDGNIILVVVTERDMTQLNALKDQLEQSRMLTEKIRNELSELSIMELKKQEIVAKSKEMRQVLITALKLAHLEVSNILILGESGTGKGLLAKFIHKNSSRENSPFIQINCAALPESLLEAELFGYERGAFTGAREQGKVGLFELAQGGTLFLDEIGDLPLAVQAKLLKYLDDHEIMRLGGTKPIKIDCVVIAATNRDLEMLTKNREFREDLLYRLDAFTIRIPPLRKRPEDIFKMINYFLRKYNQNYKQKKRISSEALDALQFYSFPGNVRELKNILKKAVVMSEQEVLDDFILKNLEREEAQYKRFGRGRYLGLGLSEEVLAFEREILKSAMERCKTTREIANYLRISQSKVVRKMKNHGISRL